MSVALARSGGGGKKTVESHFKTFGIRAFDESARLQDGGAVKTLQSRSEHGAIVFSQQPLRHVDATAGVDAHQVSVVRQVMDSAERDPVHNRGHTARVAVLEDMGGLKEVCFPQSAYRASPAVGPQYKRTELVLVQTYESLSRCVAAKVFARVEARFVYDEGDGRVTDE